MATISKIKMPNDNNYDLKDSLSREVLADIIPEGVVNRFQLENNVDQKAYQMELTQIGASSFHIEGTASGQWDKRVGTITLPAGTWKMQANISGGQNNFYFYAQGTSHVWRTNSTSSSTANIYTITEETTFNIYLRVASGYSVNMDVKLGIGLASKFSLIGANAAMVDHALTNSELTDVAAGLVDKGAKNLANYELWRDNVTVNRGTKSIASNGAITISATGNDCYTDQAFSSSALLPCRIPVTPGQTYIATWTSTNTGSGNKYFYMFPNGSSTGAIAAKAADQMCLFTAPAGCTYLTWRIGCSTSGDTVSYNNFMICTLESWKISHNYVPFALSNFELTQCLDTVESHDTVTTGTTIADTGITIDIPAGSGTWAVGGILEFSGSQPVEIQLRCTIGTGTSQYLIARATNANDNSLNFMFLSATGLVRARSDKDLHIKVFAKSYSSANNTVSVIARRIRKQA